VRCPTGEESMPIFKEKDGKLTAVYIDREVSGFAIHLIQK